MFSTLIASKLWAGTNFSVITPVIKHLVKEAPALYPLLDPSREHPEHIRSIARYIYYFAQQIIFGILAMAGLELARCGVKPTYCIGYQVSLDPLPGF